MKKVYIFLLFQLIYFPVLLAQEFTLTGTVLSAEDDLGLPGVSVLIKGTTSGTVTDAYGQYTLKGVNSEDVIVFSFVGFEKQEIKVGVNKSISVVMLPDATELEELVVTALGIKRQKRELGYSTEKLEGDIIVQSSTANVLGAIKGRATGVNVTEGDGIEGGTTRIVIRGNNNLFGNNQPLIVVDGVPMDNIPGMTDIGRGVDWGSAINNINAFDIEDYTIIKGGPASAPYGSRGANGVIEIRTKRGMKQNGIGVQYNFSYKITQPYRYREVQNIYGHGGPVSLTPVVFPTAEEGDTILYTDVYQYGTENLVLNQEGETSTSAEQFGYYGSAVSWGPKMEGQMIKWWDGEMRPWSPQPDNYKIPYSNGYTMTNNIAAMGGGEKGTFRVSITRLDHTSIIENSNYDQTTVNFGSSVNISKRVKADVAMTYINYNRLNSPIVGEDQNSFNKGFLYEWDRSYKGVDKENYALPSGARNPQDGFPYLYVSPYLWWNFYNQNTTMSRDIYTGSISLTYSVTNWLDLFFRAGRDFNLTQFEKRNKPVDVVGLDEGYYSNSLNRHVSGNYDWMVIATEENIFNSKISVKFTFGGAALNITDYGMSGRSGEWYYPNYYTFGNYTENTYSELVVGPDKYTVVDEFGNTAGSVVASEVISQRRTNSLYSFLSLSYDKYLYLDLTGRNDWTSTLPSYANSYFYPSISLSFIASEAFHIQDHARWINFMKIRGGVSQTASDMEPYQSDAYYTVGRFGGEQTSFLDNTIPPVSLKPQRVNAYEAGINMGFLDNKIDFDFTYYYFYSFDQLLALPIPLSSGAGYVQINEGVLTNQGVEISINTVPVQTRNFFFRTGLNYTHNRNKVVSLGTTGAPLEIGNIWGLNGPAMILQEGDDYGTISGYDYVYHENGQPILNDDGTHYKITDTRVPIGNASPEFLAGWYMEFNYKGISLSTLVDTKWGGEIYCGSSVIAQQTGTSPSTLVEREGGGLPYTDPEGNTSNIGVILPGVYEDGTPNDKIVHYYYKYLPNAGGWGPYLSTPGIIENTWIKMREMALSYTIPQNLLKKTMVFQNLRLSIVGRDLFYFYTTLPDKINPEGILGSGNAQGFEWASYPGTRSFTFSISANF
ncbi:MAG: SusC/RagA family TonB-linked outer membrane protein [Bacteroidales bacterium]